MNKPWRWTKYRIAIRTLLEGGTTVKELKNHTVNTFNKNNPDARPSERAASIASMWREIDAVAERIAE